MRSRTSFHMAILVLIACLLAACTPGKPVGTPNPPGATVEVGGWRTAETTLVGTYTTRINVTGGVKGSGWQVTVLSVDPSVGSIRINTEITNHTANPGAIDLITGPILMNAQGNEYLPIQVNLAGYEDIPFSSSGSGNGAANCMISTDAQGVRHTDCEAVIYGTDGKVLLAVGTQKTVEITFIFPMPAETSSLVMEWLDGTLFAIP